MIDSAVVKKIRDSEYRLLQLSGPSRLIFVMMSECWIHNHGNLIQPVGIAKLDPKDQSIKVKPGQVFEYSISKQHLNLAKEQKLILPFLTETALFGYPLEKDKTYRIIVVYRPYGINKDGICSEEKIIKFK